MADIQKPFIKDNRLSGIKGVNGKYKNRQHIYTLLLL